MISHRHNYGQTDRRVFLQGTLLKRLILRKTPERLAEIALKKNNDLKQEIK